MPAEALLALAAAAVARGGDHWYKALQQRQLTSEQWWHFHQEGYLTLPGFFGGERFELIEAARDHIDKMWANRKQSHMKHVFVQETPQLKGCLLYTSPSPRDRQKSRMPSSA